MQNLRVGTFNLFQFVKPPYSWYEPKSTFSLKEWNLKTTWIKKQLCDMNCDIVGFQEVFSKDILEILTKESDFDHFTTVDIAKLDTKNQTTFKSTTVALASKYPILELQEVKPNQKTIDKHKLENDFKFSRTPLKALIQLPNNLQITVYVNHFKSNRSNELEYTFTKNHSLDNKIEKTKEALDQNISKSLKQRLCETSSLFFDFQKTKTPIISLCDLNDKEFSLSIEALTNEAYHEKATTTNTYLLNDVYDLIDKTIYNPHPEQKEIQRTPTSYFQGYGNVLDYIFVSNDFDKNIKNHIGEVISYEIFNKHLHNNPHGSLLQSDHAQVVCEIKMK